MPGPGFKKLYLEIAIKTEEWSILKARIMSVSLEQIEVYLIWIYSLVYNLYYQKNGFA